LSFSLGEFVQVRIEGEKMVSSGYGLGAQDTVNYVKTLLREQGQSPHKHLLIIICNSLIMQDIDETARGPVPVVNYTKTNPDKTWGFRV